MIIFFTLNNMLNMYFLFDQTRGISLPPCTLQDKDISLP